MHRPNWIALVHVARRDLGLSEEQYRAVLAGAGLASSKDITTQDQADAVMAGMKALGFEKKPATRRPKWKDDWWRCSPAKRALIEVLWANMARNPTPEALRKMVARIIHIDHPAWIDDLQAKKVIIALKAMTVQAGGNPEVAARQAMHPRAPGGAP